MRTVVLLLLVVAPAVAAPVPKAVKKAPPSADGVWEVVEFDGHNGKIRSNIVGYCWMIDGDRMSTGKKSAGELSKDNLPNTLRVRDEAKPHLRELVNSPQTKFSCVLEVDGDTLRWAYATDPSQTISECKPGDGVYYYVFKRVTGK